MNHPFLLLCLSLFLSGPPAWGQDPEISFQLGHHSGVTRMISDQGFSSVFSADKDGNIIHWDVTSGRQVRIFPSPGEPVQSLLLLEKEKQLAVAYRNQVQVWSLVTGEPICSVAFSKENNLKEILIFRSGYLVAGTRQLYTCDREFNILKTFSYDKVFGEEEKPKPENRKFTVDINNTEEEAKQGLFGGIFLSPDEKQISFAVFNNNYPLRYRGLFTIDSDTFGLINHIRTTDMYTMKVSPDRKSIYRMRAVVKRAIYKNSWPENSKQNTVAYGSSSAKNNITAYGAGNRFMCFGDTKGTLVVCRNNDNRHVFVLKGHETPITSIGFSADENYLFSADEKGLILLWDLNTGKPVRTFKGIANTINSILYNSSGDRITIGFNNGEIKMWDLMSNEQKKLNLRSIKGKELTWSVLKIDSVRNDSIVYFRCKGKDEKNTFVYDAVWDIYAGNVMLSEFALNEKEAEKVNRDTISCHGQRITFNGTDLVFCGPDSSTTSKASGHSAPINDIAYNSRYGYYTTAGQDGVLRHWKSGTENVLFTSGCMGERGFFHVLPKGYYYADKSSLKYLSFRINEKIYPFEQFDLRFNRPDLVMREFPFADSTLVVSFEKAFEKRKKRTGYDENQDWHPGNAPRIEITGNHPAAVNGVYSIAVSARAGSAPLHYLYIDVNGVTEAMFETGPVQAFSKTHEITLNEGLNRITVYAADEQGTLSLKEEINVKNTVRLKKPVLYMIAIGSGMFNGADSTMNLKYAGKDAQDIFALFGKDKHYEKIIKQLYTDHDVKKEILPEIDRVLSQATVNDMVLVFYAGHGLLDKKLDYYLSTAGTDFNAPEEQSILYTDLENILARCRSRKKLLLLDACHSGELDKEEITARNTALKTFVGDVKFRGMQEELEMSNNKAFELSRALFADVDKTVGTAIISSASGAELAMEGDQWNNGLFTYVVLTGLRSKKADLNGDRNIQVSELLYYVNEKVRVLTKGKQNPNGRAENIYYDFRVR